MGIDRTKLSALREDAAPPKAPRLLRTQSPRDLASRWSIASLPSMGSAPVTDMPQVPGGSEPGASSWPLDESQIALFEGLPGIAEPRMFVSDLKTG